MQPTVTDLVQTSLEALHLERQRNGGYRSAADPGEPSTGAPRWSITDEEGRILQALVRGRRVLEIGTGLGVSAWYMAAVTDVVTVDIDAWVQLNVWPLLKPLGVTCIPQWPDQYDSFDVVFIDGDHRPEHTRADILRAKEHLNWHGLILVHDYRFDVVRRVVDDLGLLLAEFRTANGIAVITL